MLDAKLRFFVQQGVSMLVASRSGRNEPCVSRATGCEFLSDDRLLVYLPTARSAKLLKAIAGSGAVAMVFSEPGSHKTIQVKGSDAEVLADTHAEPELLAKYRSDFRSHLVPLGFGAAMVDALVHVDAAETTVVRFTPTSVFDQTPGPRAGEPLVITR